jgi:hypothetical protein
MESSWGCCADMRTTEVHVRVVAIIELAAIAAIVASGASCAPDRRLQAASAQRTRPGFVLYEAHTQTQQSKPDTLVTYVTARSVRVSHAAGAAILDLDTGRIVLLDSASRTSRSEDLSTWEQRIHGALEALADPSASGAAPRFQRTGQHAEIAGYRCERYMLFTTRDLLGTRETVEQQLWVTTELELPAGAFEAYQRALATLDSVGLPRHTAYPEGIILRRETRIQHLNAAAREAPKVEASIVFRIESKQLSSELFMIPSDYRGAREQP